MRKTEAIKLLGGNLHAAAEAVGVTYQAIGKWPKVLPSRIADRVQAALWRKSQGIGAPLIDYFDQVDRLAPKPARKRPAKVEG